MKKRILSFFTGVCMLAVTVLPGMGNIKAVAAEPDLTDGLVGYWNFDDGKTDNLADSNLKAELTGAGVSLSKDGGISGGSAHFTKQENSYIRLSQALNASTEDFSIGAWVKFDKDAFASGTKINLFQQTGDGRTILYLESGGPTYGTYLGGADVLSTKNTSLGVWNHIMITSSHTTKTVQFYLNGQLAGEQALGGEAYNGVTDVLIGSHKNPTQEGAIKGEVDELRFYKSVVTADMVEAMCAPYVSGVETEALSSLLADAKKLTGSVDEAAVAALEAAIKSAEDFLKQADIDREGLQKQMEALEKAIADYLTTIDITISVDTSNEVREIGEHMFGINHRYANNGYGTFNVEQQKIEDEFNAYVKEANFGCIRYPGGAVANLFDWKRAIGPMSERKKTIHGLPDSNLPIEPNFGVDEAMSWIYDDLGSDAIWVYGMGQGSASDAADLFEYLNAPNDGSNPNGGTDWAAERAKNGHPDPYGVTNFEIGNEIGYWSQTYWMDGRAAGRSNADVYIKGGTMTFGQNTSTVKEEDWRTSAAYSDGSANQVRYVKYVPVTEGTASVYVGGQKWEIVPALEGQGAKNVCTFDYKTGKITFGDGVNGNIPTGNRLITAAYTTEQDGFVAYYKALKAIAEEIGAEVNVYACIFEEEFMKLMAENDYNAYYDGVVIHPYSDSGSIIPQTDPDFYDKILGRSQQYNMTRVQTLVNNMEKYAPGMHKVPVLSEFGIFSYNSPFVRSIGHAVYIANEMIDYVNFGTPYINKHCLSDFPYEADSLGAGSQCVIQTIKNSDGSLRGYVSTPSAKMFSIFNNMTGTIQVDQNVTGNETYYTYSGYDVPTVKVLSTKDDEGNTYVTVVNNRKDNETPVNIAVDSRDLSGTKAEVWYLTSDKEDDENTIDNPNKVDVVKTTVDISQSILRYTLAPHSITSFKIPKAAELTGIEVAKLPDKTVYKPGEKLDTTGMKVMAVYSDGTETEVTEGVTVSDLLDKEGKQEITVTYQGMTAVFEVTVESEGGVEQKPSFKDVSSSDWFYKEVEYVNKNGLMTGISKTEFAPGQSLARAQFAIILYRMNDKPKVDYTAKFKDVFQGDWYADAILWASSTKVVTGYSNGNFGPSDQINREQMALMMYRYARYKKYDVNAKADIRKFSDAASVSSYAKEAMEWAFGTGIITGKDSGTRLDPQGSASRAECATIIKRFVEKYK